MGYKYEYTYPIDETSAGYSGPIAIELGQDRFAAGILEATDHRNLIRSSIQRILGTVRGERVMQPEFGSNLRKMLFEPIDNILVEDIREGIKNTIESQDPRVIVTGIDFDFDYDNHTIYIAISYKYNRTGLEDSFNFIIS